MSSMGPSRGLQKLDVSAPIEEFIAAIEKDGGCICTGFASVEDVAKATAEVQPHLDADKPWSVRTFSYPQFHLSVLISSRANSFPPRRDVATA